MNILHIIGVSIAFIYGLAFIAVLCLFVFLKGCQQGLNDAIRNLKDPEAKRWRKDHGLILGSEYLLDLNEGYQNNLQIYEIRKNIK